MPLSHKQDLSEPMHILIGLLLGLAVASVIIILWAQGSLFACVFLSIPTGLGLLFFISDTPVIGLICVLLLAGIWAPRYYLGRRETCRHPLQDLFSLNSSGAKLGTRYFLISSVANKSAKLRCAGLAGGVAALLRWDIRVQQPIAHGLHDGRGLPFTASFHDRA